MPGTHARAAEDGRQTSARFNRWPVVAKGLRDKWSNNDLRAVTDATGIPV
jgi:hypothetical protein